MSAGLLAAGMAIQGMGMLGRGNRAEDQLDQQRRLTDIQKRANEDLMKKIIRITKANV